MLTQRIRIMNIDGYGKILEVDLSRGKISSRKIEPDFARKYLGGIGFGARIIYDEVGIEVDPYSPQNVIVFANGPFTGTHVPCGSRTEVTTKHPETMSIGTGNTGGVWGAALKHAGYDFIIIRGSSEKPVYLLIDDGDIKIKDASHLWGQDARRTTEILQEELSSKFKVLAIGQAGEHLVRYAHILFDYYHVAGRSGGGGVMGSKKLKAIAVRGTGTALAARPEEFQQAVKESRERLKAADAANWKPGAGSMETFHRAGEVPGLGRADQLKYSIGKGAICWACGMNCYNDMGLVKSGKFAGLKESNITRTQVIGLFGHTLGVDNLPAIWACKNVSQRLAIDYVTVVGVIKFVMDLLENGIITKEDIDGVDLRRGNEDAIIEIMRKIAYREGIGDVLADGTLKAAERIGKGAEKFVSLVKGREGGHRNMPEAGHEGNWWFLGAFTNPRGDLTTSTHFTTAQPNPNWPVEKYDMLDETKEKIYSMPPEQCYSTWEGKAMMLKWSEDLHSLADALGLCFFPTHMRMAVGAYRISRLYSAFTGTDIPAEEIMETGERLFNLFKAHTVRSGMTRKDDLAPGSLKEADQKRMDRFLDEYYALRGWDTKLGVPTRQKLASLGLEDIADDLARLGKLPM
jgi:aldehyde:ferredoxin oxidoreductase